MNIKNEFIKIKNGNKRYEFKNTILDVYLNHFATAQTSLSTIRQENNIKCLKYCLLKFDDSLIFDENTNLNNNQFDICLLNDNAEINQNISENQVTIQYNYNFCGNPFILKYNPTAITHDISQFYGKKITAIGFNIDYQATGVSVCAVLDTSNYNIYLQEKQDFIITRKDIISTDALFWSESDKITGQSHLAPNDEKLLIEEHQVNEFWYVKKSIPVLHSIGLSNSVDSIEKEYVVEEDVQMSIDNNQLILEDIINPANVSKTYLPNFLKFYTSRETYKYLIIKYKLYQILSKNVQGETVHENIDTGYFYHSILKYKDDDFGKKKIILSYERS